MHPGRAIIRFAAMLALLAAARSAPADFDHSHRAWSALLGKYVVVLDAGRASRVRYAGFARDRAALRAYLDSLSGVPEAGFKGWTVQQRAAYLINAYNAFTVELVLTRYPDLRSIRDLGGAVFNKPWQQKWFKLFGRETSLDAIEHGMLRAKGAYEEPRVHYALNCASVGCPMLREEAYVAERIDAQLEEQARRFLSDRTRNRFNPDTGRIEVSKIFDWYQEDWRSGYRGIGANAEPVVSRERYFGRYAELLADGPAGRGAIRERKAPLSFLDYDWSLNDAR